MSKLDGLDGDKVADVKAAFFLDGLTVAEWARKRNFAPSQVYAVLSGRNKGRYGRGHDIAVALGLKSKGLATQAATQSGQKSDPGAGPTDS